MSQSPEVALRDLATAKGLVGGPFGSSLGRKDYVESGVPVIRGANLSYGRSVAGDFVYVSESKFERDLARNSARSGDIIYTQRGTLGQVALVGDGGYPKYVVSQSQMRLRVDPEVADATYVYYASKSPLFRRQVVDNAITTGVPHINLGILSRLTIPLPALGSQRAIADLLSALDDKIAANTRLTIVADELAESLVNISLSGGSRRKSIAEVAEFHNRHRVPLSSRERELRVGTVPYYGANGVIDTVDESLFDGIYVLVGEDGSVITPHGNPVVTYIWGPAWVNNHAHILSGRTLSTDLLFYLIRNVRIESIVTGAVQPKVSMGNLKSVNLEVPLSEALPQLDREIGQLRARCRSAADESRRLEMVRDALLPALMSGRLRVRDAEVAIESAADDGDIESEVLATGTPR